MPEVTETKPTEPAPAPPQFENPNMLVGVLVSRVRATLNDNGPTVASVLEWLATQKTQVIREAIQATQPKGWAVASEPLVKSLSDDQCVGMLATLMSVYVQTL